MSTYRGYKSNLSCFYIYVIDYPRLKQSTLIKHPLASLIKLTDPLIVSIKYYVVKTDIFRRLFCGIIKSDI